MAHTMSLCLFAGAALGLVALSIQLWLTTRHLRGPKPLPRSFPPMSILKPLCGLDDSLEENLISFLDIDYPSYEVVLGVKDHHDPAFGLALQLARRFPGRFRLVIQRGEPGHNPKVNQLITLAHAAKHDLLVISDSNARVGRGYLSEMAALFEDPNVGCVTNPIVGFGERRWGSLLDNLHMSSSVGPGMIGAKLFAGQDLVVGKSMALRRADLADLGGFDCVADILAEDYVLGRAVRKLGKRVALARTLVMSVSRQRTVADFWRRYARWSVIHRTALTGPTYLAQVLLNPIPLAALALATDPSQPTALALLGVILAKTAVDVTTASVLGHRFGRRLMPAVLVKDLILFVTWTRGMFVRTVDWRGNQLRVGAGSRLAASREAPAIEATS
jgi:ceramide glucosyltransferase